jgi:uncharacterized protein involved in response to NO
MVCTPMASSSFLTDGPLGPAREWRKEPYRLLFPLGAVLAWAGVLHWLLLGLGVPNTYQAIFHSIAQVQGFMTCFGLGFLFTFVPRRTGTAPPAPWELAVGASAPVLVTAAAWVGQVVLGQWVWLGLAAVVLRFVIVRLLAPGPGRTVPPSLGWLALAFALAFAGVGLTLLPPSWVGFGWAHRLGSALLLQGMFTALVVGVGGLLFPVFTRGEGPGGGPGGGAGIALHGAAMALFVASFAVEVWVALPLGYVLRAAVCATVLVLGAEIWRVPTLKGLHRWLFWLAAWLLPVGYALVAMFPAHRTAALHVVFLGSFALMAFAISVHVVLSHGGYGALLDRWPAPLTVAAALFLVALLARGLVSVDPARFRLWIGLAAGAFLLGTTAWAYLVLPKIRPRGTAPH